MQLSQCVTCATHTGGLGSIDRLLSLKIGYEMLCTVTLSFLGFSFKRNSYPKWVFYHWGHTITISHDKAISINIG